MKKIVFSTHARQRLLQRDINEETVFHVMEKPDAIYNSFRERKIAKKLIGKTIYSVVYIEKESFIKIITIYRD